MQSSLACRTKGTSILQSSHHGRTIGRSYQDDHGCGVEDNGVKRNGLVLGLAIVFNVVHILISKLDMMMIDSRMMMMVDGDDNDNDDSQG